MNFSKLLTMAPLGAFLFALTSVHGEAQIPELRFDHNHTFSEVVDYLEAVVEGYPGITKLHNIGRSFQGRDLLVRFGGDNHEQGKE